VSATSSAGSASITYVGHSTVVIAIDGVTFVTDPLLRRRVGHLVRYAVPAPRFAADVVLVSHAHYDHLDPLSLARFGRATPVVIPAGVGGMLRRRRFRDVREVRAGDRLGFGAIEVTATAADHPGTRPPTTLRAEAIGFLLRGSVTVYFAGDTGLFDGMGAIGDEGIDVALIPVDGWGPRVGAGHLDPTGAAEAVRLLRPRLAVPIHWGTYAPLGRPPVETRAAADSFAAAVPHVARVLAPGERLTL
jgi:L-ascorbate metabolism protein UlaG (beta-lactamase superfamily)